MPKRLRRRVKEVPPSPWVGPRSVSFREVDPKSIALRRADEDDVYLSPDETGVPDSSSSSDEEEPPRSVPVYEDDMRGRTLTRLPNWCVGELRTLKKYPDLRERLTQHKWDAVDTYAKWRDHPYSRSGPGIPIEVCRSISANERKNEDKALAAVRHETGCHYAVLADMAQMLGIPQFNVLNEVHKSAEARLSLLPEQRNRSGPRFVRHLPYLDMRQGIMPGRYRQDVERDLPYLFEL